MNAYFINWLPASLTDDNQAVVTVTFEESVGDDPVELFKDYEHTHYGCRSDVAAIMKRILTYHIGHEPTDELVWRFISRPTLSSSVVTKMELQDFFGETDQQESLKV